MVRRRMLVGMLAACALPAVCSIGRTEMKQVPVVRLHSTIEVAASPAAVWAFLTTGKNMVTWCPVWKSQANAKINLAKVGDVLDFTDEWGNNGRSVVTHLVKEKELRVAHEPNDGSYMCQAKIVLTPSAKGTTVHYYEQYTDESKPEDLQATAKKTEGEMMQTLAAVKKGVEKKS